eukprot:21860-Amphidinium_carterae.1
MDTEEELYCQRTTKTRGEAWRILYGRRRNTVAPEMITLVLYLGPDVTVETLDVKRPAEPAPVDASLQPETKRVKLEGTPDMTIPSTPIPSTPRPSPSTSPDALVGLIGQVDLALHHYPRVDLSLDINGSGRALSLG